MKTGRFKVDYTGSSWSYDAFAVYEERRVWGFTFWRKVHTSSDPGECRRFADHAATLPVFRG